MAKLEKLTDLQIRNLKPRASRYTVSDGGGLEVEVLPNTGTLVWRYRYWLNGKRERVTIGEYGDRADQLGLAEARERHQELRKLVRQGVSPIKAKHKQETGTVEALFNAWVQNYVRRRVKRSESYERTIGRDVLPVIGEMLVEDVERADIWRVLDPIRARGSDQMAKHTFKVMRLLFGWAVTRGVIEKSPTDGIDANRDIAPNVHRERYLDDEELRAFWAGLDAPGEMTPEIRNALRLLMLTMVRKNELLGATWDEVDIPSRVWTIPAARMKKQRDHVVPLSDEAVAILIEQRKLGSRWVAPSSRGGKMSHASLNHALTKAEWFGLPRFSPHDFRRTASTHLNEADWPGDDIELQLAHNKADVRSIYNRARRLDARRLMLDWWARYVTGQTDDLRMQAAMQPREDNVTRITA
jgi:integrase